MLGELLKEHLESVIQISAVVAGFTGVYFKMGGRLRENAKSIAALRKSIKEDRISIEREIKEDRVFVEKELQEIRERMDTHDKAEKPHPNCPAHATAIEDISDRLDRIQTDISNIRSNVDTFKNTMLFLLPANASIPRDKLTVIHQSEVVKEEGNK